MSKDQLLYPQSKPLLKHLDRAADRARMHRSRIFDDTLQLIICTLGRPLMEEQYMETVARHADGKNGSRSIDAITQFFGELVAAMDDTNQDLLGDIFQGAISDAAAGQFFTPDAVCKMSVQMTIPAEPTGIEGRKSVNDPCCGSGRMLLAAAEIQPNWHFVGQDLDFRCVQMTAINLALRNIYGHVIYGDTLANEQHHVYETGRVELWGNVIRNVAVNAAPASIQRIVDAPPTPTSTIAEQPEHNQPTSQLRLFD